MSTTTLSRQYGNLTTWERVPLILAAEARRDEAEHRSLCETAPVKLLRLPDYLLGTLPLHTLTMLYVTEQLEHVANYWHALWRLSDPEEDHRSWRYTADVHAYRFACNAEAWRRFCAELHIDPDALTAGNCQPWQWMLKYAEENMPNVAPTRDEMVVHLREHGVADPDPLTADDLLASWRNVFNLMTASSRGARGTGEPVR